MGRIKGTSKTEMIRPTVKLITSNQYPVGSIVAMWIGSRYENTVDPCDVDMIHNITDDDSYNYWDCSINLQNTARQLVEDYPEFATGNDLLADAQNVINNVAKTVLMSNLPPLDALNFTFEIDNANVAWREQLVRGRQPQNFWTQTSRTADLTTVDINMSESIEHYGGAEAVNIYKDTCDTIREAYKKLAELGVPTEDIRLVPQGMTHRVYWMVPYRTLVSALKKRMSWIAQASLWTPIVEDIQSELFNCCPMLADFIGQPSDVRLAHGRIVHHTYDIENEDRFTGKDPQPCDPLWLAYHERLMPEHTDINFYDQMKSYYIKLWSREVCDILGWDKDDPSKIGPYDRPFSWFQDHDMTDIISFIINRVAD